MRTPLSVLFWCCPPGPPALKVSTLHWLKSSSSVSGIGKGAGNDLSLFMVQSLRNLCQIAMAKGQAGRLCLMNRGQPQTKLSSRYASRDGAKAVARVGCGRAQGRCGCQTRKDDECDAEASGRSPDAATTANAAVPCRISPVPFGLLRHGAICFVGSPCRSVRLCLRTPAFHMAPWRE